MLDWKARPGGISAIPSQQDQAGAAPAILRSDDASDRRGFAVPRPARGCLEGETVSQRPIVDLIYIDSGGGHRAAARSLEAAVRLQQKPWELRLQGAQELLDSIDFIRKLTGIPFQDIYNIMLRRGWTMGSRQLLPVMHLLIRLTHRWQVRVLEAHWRDHPADMVVSVIPHYNRALRQAFERACPGRPFVTIMTDIVDYPPHFWIENLDQYLICGSERARQQALYLKVPEQRVLAMSGMILHPRFHAPRGPKSSSERAAGRMRLGLDPGLPTGLVMFGGVGSKGAVRVVRAVNRPGLGVQLIVLCGRHAESLQALRSIDAHIPLHIEGFTRDVAHFMQLADFFIGKPGPGSISEALAMHLPVIVECNMRTMIHERYNAHWIREQQLGLVVSSFDKLGEAIPELLRPERFNRFRANAAGIRNSAVYDAVRWLDSILENHGTDSTEGILLRPDFNQRLTTA
jgi:Glycosyltransferase family 28 C-terminal domain